MDTREHVAEEIASDPAAFKEGERCDVCSRLISTDRWDDEDALLGEPVMIDERLTPDGYKDFGNLCEKCAILLAEGIAKTLKEITA